MGPETFYPYQTRNPNDTKGKCYHEFIDKNPTTADTIGNFFFFFCLLLCFTCWIVDMSGDAFWDQSFLRLLIFCDQRHTTHIRDTNGILNLGDNFRAVTFEIFEISDLCDQLLLWPVTSGTYETVLKLKCYHEFIDKNLTVDWYLLQIFFWFVVCCFVCTFFCLSYQNDMLK